MIRITRTLTATCLALSLAAGAVTSTATPAQANNDKAAVAIIGGLIALYAIGQAMQKQQGAANAQVHVTRPQHEPQVHRPHRPRQLVAPARCFVEGRDAGGYFRGYVRRCMENNAARPDLLPQQCLARVDTQRGPRLIYRGRCLAQNGWVREAGFRP